MFTSGANSKAAGIVRMTGLTHLDEDGRARMVDVSDAGILSTASDLVFSGNREGHFFALNARDGKLLWTRYLGGQVAASPITWSVDGKQYVTIASGRGVFTFGLPED